MIGLTLSGRYELLARVGGGGMALVYKARDLLLNRFVAVKVLRQQFTHDEDFVKRFRREAQAAASLSHPNIVSIYDVGQVEDTHYIVMEFIDGANLNEIIRERAPLQADEAVKITAQICDALEHAHHNQIIHRDIKPHNILIGNNGRVKVTDFGIARAVTSSTITQTGSVIGSVHYFSPEHAKGVTTGEKSDLYSLGIVLYQMVTGRLPFLGESPISVALKHLQDPFEQPRKVNPYIPQSVENIILRAMRKNPQERYQSAKEMWADLDTSLQPQRLNEPAVHYSSDEDDEQDKTRVIPAIRPDMRNTIEAPAVKTANNEDRWNSDGLSEPKRKWIIPTVLAILAIVLIGVLIWAIGELRHQTNSDVVVPTVVGEKEAEARRMLIAAGFTIQEPNLTEIVDDEKDVGLVVKQSKMDMEAKEGSPIQLTIGIPKDLPSMPDLSGMSFDEASAKLQEMGVDKDNILPSEKFDESEPGTVLEQVPEADAKFDPTAEDTNITLIVSKGEEAFEMPNLIGKTEAEAKAIILKYDLKLSEDKILRESSYSQPKGKVFKQFPEEPNEMVTPKTEVMIWVSSGYPADSREQKLSVTVSPAVEGQTSKIRIVYSDATGDNIEWDTKEITATTSIPITLILSPNKDGQISIYRDGQFLQKEPVPYRVIPASDAPVTDPGDPGDGTDTGEVPANGDGTDPNGDDANPE
ncbi:Stk1 family PASTA domain-containing Ser/Thr kinase [Cohnella luojiensis]|uniref:Serine/threonine-protein kinase PrkC n=1 Tax=Cohnella luojiensis TaxID=652876 RepID=A0A4Y8M9Q0_9BACL|nr:Stk1 family PASTA domain-containing Ser/Thr kinase [Cohnella luojiensis]TFE31845.1 Stk1 family PASTA domain-containing Ser/Thr kinase [Cohnella luojiensis]